MAAPIGGRQGTFYTPLGKLDTFVIIEKNSAELNLANEVWNLTAIFSKPEIAIREMIAWNYEWIQQIKTADCMD